MPKTGGTTVFEVLKEALGEDSVTDQMSGVTHRELLLVYGWKRMISAHTKFEVGDTFDPNRYYLTMLREPLDRALSNYWFARGLQDSDARPQVRLAKSHSFEELLHLEASPARTMLANVQATHYAGLMLEPGVPCSESELYKAAVQAVDRFDLVGVMGELEDFLLVAGADCGIMIQNEIPRLNETRRRQGVADLSSAYRLQLEKLNGVDIELYHYARQLFRRQRGRSLRWAGNRARAVGGGSVAAPIVQKLPPLQPKVLGGEDAHIDTLTIAGHASEIGGLLSGEIAVVSIGCHSEQTFVAAVLRLEIHSDAGQLLFQTSSLMLGRSLSLMAGTSYLCEFVFRNDLRPGRYFVSSELLDQTGRLLHARRFATVFQVGHLAGYQFEGLVNLNPNLRILSDGKEIAAEPGNNLVSYRQLGVCSQPLDDFRAEIRIQGHPDKAAPGELLAIEIEVSNLSQAIWYDLSNRPVQIGSRWWRRGSPMGEASALRTRLPKKVFPGETLRVFAQVRAPHEEGVYTVRICLVQEYIAWFDDHASGYAELSMVVAVTNHAN